MSVTTVSGILVIAAAGAGASVVGALWLLVETVRLRARIRANREEIRQRRKIGEGISDIRVPVQDKVAMLTCRKTNDLLFRCKDAFISGYVITFADAVKAKPQVASPYAVVDHAAVRWLSMEDHYDLMHPAPAEYAAPKEKIDILYK